MQKTGVHRKTIFTWYDFKFATSKLLYYNLESWVKQINKTFLTYRTLQAATYESNIYPQ